LGRLAVVPWRGVDEIDAKAEGLRAEFLAALGQTEEAIVAYDKAIATLARLQTRIVNWQRLRGILHVRQANLSQAKHDAQLAEALALELHGTIKKEEGQFDEALLYYKKAALLAETLQEITHLARIERHILHIHGYRRNLPKVEEYARTAMNHFQAIHDLAHVAQVQYELGGVYIECGHFAQGIQQSLQALRFFERAKSPYHIANIAVNLAQGYLGHGDLAAGEQYAQLAMTQEEPEAMSYAYWCLGKIKAQQGNLSHAYACFAEVIRNGTQQPYIVAFAHKEAALLHLQQEQLPEGVYSLQKALHLFEKLGIAEEAATIEALLSKAKA
jgi:tetratricopeptide (TPR) repeat protein